MDFSVERQDNPKSIKSKKPKKSLLKSMKAVGHDIKHAAEQWWKPSDQIPQPLTPVIDEPSDLQKKMATISIDDRATSSEDNRIFLSNRDDLLRKKLFLMEEEYPKLYFDAYQRLEKFEIEMAKYNKNKESNPDIEKPKYAHEPTRQLSHDGVALMSHIYAQKDGSAKQPLTVRTFEGFEKIIKFIDNSPNGTDITLIIQFDKSFIDIIGKDLHRLAVRLEKIDSAIHAIYLDSAITSNTLIFSTMKLTACINEIALKNAKEKTIVHTHLEKSGIGRQTDKFQCTVFAIKDARELNKDNHSLSLFQGSNPNVLPKQDSHHDYSIPAKYLKGLQSRTYQEFASNHFGDTVVSRKGLTLKEVYAKHPDQSYIPHFSKKYESLVMACANSLTDAELDTAINNYTAEGLTTERLTAVYANKSTLRKG